MPSYPINLDGSAAESSPTVWNVTTRSGKGDKINATEYDNSLISLREAVNDLNDRILLEVDGNGDLMPIEP